ncbi:hypothetical protein ZYGR_0Z00640 [Zygosaccharomyces rouxii]|uniref:ZYRO0G01672p n=2 Tax=Zygosaccharomyces rouxii TaxID=4956 RepID=C5E1V0_ZYGRC|nr:uncharacterized protein ZYRO0G01672g [Zygosaccharomyces rouxii]KAH9202141.1 YT521-B-like domain-containing protein [Zygosaccharomyces rouxii]GAV50641.1 hypothetical protein ZYGR_0Z00640 [Zygosaccharomyces rouxii]CAR29143.1 ZYRO0G01672p [Zygosaccharomyces rouxii]
MDWYYVDRPVRTIEDSFKDLESIFKDKNNNDTPRIPLTDELYKPFGDTNINLNSSISAENNNYVATPRLPLASATLEDSSAVCSPVQPVQSPLNTLQTLEAHAFRSVVPKQIVSPQPQPQPPLQVDFQSQVHRAAAAATSVTSPIGGISTNANHSNWKPPQKKSSAIIPPWIHVPDHSRFFVIKSSSLEHVKKSFYNGIWSSTFYGNKRLSEAYESLPQGAKIYLLFSVNASGRFCGVAEMSSNLREDLDTSIWGDNSRYRHAFKVRWIVVRDVHNRSLKQFLIPANDMKPVTNSRDTQEIPATISKSILKLFKYEQSEVQSFLDDDYS